jgi:hypothetical protein
MTPCKRCGRLMNPEPWHDSIHWCAGCWKAWAKGPVTQALSQEFVRDSIRPATPARRALCVCGAHSKHS